MRAAVFHGADKPFALEDVEVQEPQANEVTVRIAASGICGSDVHVVRGTIKIGNALPIVLGHEGAGIVEAIGPGITDLKAGDRVIISMGAPCGHCGYCGEGRAQFCSGNPPRATWGEMDDGTYRLSQGGVPVHSFVGIGSLGEYAVVRRRKVVKYEIDAPFESMSLISCGVTTGLGAALNAADIKPGSTVMVFGCGGIGLCIIQGARISGASTIIAIDNNQMKLDLAADMGATHCLMSPADPAEMHSMVRAIAPRGVEFAFDAVGGRLERLKELMACTDLGGLTVAVGALPFTEAVPVIAGELIYGAKRLTGVRGGNGFPGLDIPRTLALYQSGQLKLDELVGAQFEFDEIGAAFASAAKADHGRTVVRVAPSLL